jgi:hypothetical protein
MRALFAFQWQVSSIFFVAIVPPVIGALAVLSLRAIAGRRAGAPAVADASLG